MFKKNLRFEKCTIYGLSINHSYNKKAPSNVVRTGLLMF